MVISFSKCLLLGELAVNHIRMFISNVEMFVRNMIRLVAIVESNYPLILLSSTCCILFLSIYIIVFSGNYILLGILLFSVIGILIIYTLLLFDYVTNPLLRICLFLLSILLLGVILVIIITFFYSLIREIIAYVVKILNGQGGSGHNPHNGNPGGSNGSGGPGNSGGPSGTHAMGGHNSTAQNEWYPPGYTKASPSDDVRSPGAAGEVITKQYGASMTVEEALEMQSMLASGLRRYTEVHNPSPSEKIHFNDIINSMLYTRA